MNRLTSDGTNNFVYDSNGNLLSDGETTYVYNARNKLISSTSANSTTTYTYNSEGLRISKSNTRYHLNEAGQVILETENGTPTARMIWTDKPLARKVDNTYYYYIYNAHNDVVAMTDEQGNIVKTYEYDAWGTVENETGSLANPIKYAGEYQDEETNLIYLRARYYDPVNGRFTQQDPVRDGKNHYIYCGNNPVNYVDPTGLTPSVEEAAAISKHIYDHDVNSTRPARTVSGWRLIDVWYGDDSMKMGIYIRAGDNWESPSEYVVAFRGTDLKNIRNLINDVQAYTGGESMDMWNARSKGVAFDKMKADYEITFVGHSKGGGEAIIAANATDRKSVV